jgi:glucokinase
MKLIGIDIGATKIDAGLINNNKLIKHKKILTKSSGKIIDIEKEIFEVIDYLIDKDVKGIGIGVPTFVDNNILYDTANIPCLKKLNLKKIIEKKYKIKCKIENDANCFILGEKHFGKGKKYKNLVGITLGSGLGCGIIINNKLFSGMMGGAGQISVMPYKNGQLEDYTSGKFFKKFYNKKGEDLAKSKEEKKAFLEFGKHVAEVIDIIINMLAPDAIIIGGSISKSKHLFLKSMTSQFKKDTYKRVENKIKIIFSEKEHIALFGAASLFI